MSTHEPSGDALNPRVNPDPEPEPDPDLQPDPEPDMGPDLQPDPEPDMGPGPSTGLGTGPDVDPDASPGLSPQDEVFLVEAARSLRTPDDDARWVEVSSRVLSTALRATRRSRRLRANTGEGDPVYVSEQVLIAYLREALDGPIPGAAVAGLHLDVTGRDTCTGVLIELIVQYRTTILPVADLTRARASAVLHELLGPPATIGGSAGSAGSAGSSGFSGGWTNHVHVSDVTVHDPQTEDPT